ncbi:MAG: transglutaminase-like domain-containing protein [Defluviitaleaceae bacterium]|nr:transglutaminase-like domain-containing protein [Defluviitaleaceae bacterium]
MRGRIEKVLFIAVFMLLGAASISVVAMAMANRNNDPAVFDRLVLEAGEAIPTAADFLLPTSRFSLNTESAEIVTDITVFFNPRVVLGEFAVEIIYNGAIHTSILHIVDTTPPRAVFVNALSTVGESISPASFVRDVQDATRVTPSFYHPIDVNRLGQQLVWILLTDEGGNETVINGFLYILDAVRTVYIEYGYVFEPITLESFLFNETERATAVFVTDIYELDLTVPGLFPVDILVMNRRTTFFIEVADTIPPQADTVEVTTYIGRPVSAESLVTNIYDVSPVTVTFVTEPNWDSVSEGYVDLILTDRAGNYTILSSWLNIVYDANPPVFYGLRDFFVVQHGTVAFRAPGIMAIDARDGEVEFTVDASGLNTGIVGEHTVYFVASDTSGNTARVPVSVHVTEIDPDDVYDIAWAILETIIRDGMSPFEQAHAVYRWAKDNIQYAAGGVVHDNRINAAHNGFMLRRGDCFTYYATAAVMLELLEIPNITMQRYGGRTRHWWSLINVGYGWHHFDATRHSDGGAGFHFTQTRADELSASRGDANDYYFFHPDTLPPGIVIVR